MKQAIEGATSASPTSTSRRWLFFDGMPHFGGHEVMLLRWLEELRAAGPVMPRLLARAQSRLHQLAPADIRVPPLDAVALGEAFRGWRNVLADFAAIRRAIKAERTELCIFACGAIGTQMSLVILCRLIGVKVLVYVPLLDSFEHMGYRAGRWKDRFVRHFYGRVPHAWIAVSPIQAERFKSWAAPRGPVFVLPNTVARDIEATPRLPVAPDAAAPLRVLVLGRMEAHQKGLDMLLAHLRSHAFALTGRLRFAVVGEGPYRPALEAALQSDPVLAPCLELAPWRPTVPSMAAHDVVFLPSRFEGVPLVMLEALALGVPVVASDVPGTRSYLSDDCLFAVGDMAAAMRILLRLADRRERLRLAAIGRETFEAKASGQAFSDAVGQLTQAIDGHFQQPLVSGAGRVHEARN